MLGGLVGPIRRWVRVTSAAPSTFVACGFIVVVSVSVVMMVVMAVMAVFSVLSRGIIVDLIVGIVIRR